MENLDREIDLLKEEVSKWEAMAELKNLLTKDLSEWLNARKQWLEKEVEKAKMARPKSRIKLNIMGDENSRIFHAASRGRTNKSNIPGLMVNGKWCEDPLIL